MVGPPLGPHHIAGDGHGDGGGPATAMKFDDMAYVWRIAGHGIWHRYRPNGLQPRI